MQKFQNLLILLIFATYGEIFAYTFDGSVSVLGNYSQVKVESFTNINTTSTQAASLEFTHYVANSRSLSFGWTRAEDSQTDKTLYQESYLAIRFFLSNIGRPFQLKSKKHDISVTYGLSPYIEGRMMWGRFFVQWINNSFYDASAEYYGGGGGGGVLIQLGNQFALDVGGYFSYLSKLNAEFPFSGQSTNFKMGILWHI